MPSRPNHEIRTDLYAKAKTASAETHARAPQPEVTHSGTQPAEPKNNGDVRTSIHDRSGGVNHIFTSTAAEGVRQGINSLHSGSEHIDVGSNPSIGRLVQHVKDGYGEHNTLHNVVGVFRPKGVGLIASHYAADYGKE
ncbi:hypothetical protein UFOVP111_28 [uncultured Caudovirales phage]|uniref:Uncharacterized protein n=1 Tax=uncultured Caudovirales phage TaxID=2100421 RepID=A0A6J5L5C7_9CAUD|nr:hypothetical protein UFOVP111_28 [uncultured Caudovirales phage]